MKTWPKIKYWLAGMVWGKGQPLIIMYRGFGDSNKIFVKGMAIQDNGLKPVSRKRSLWNNLRILGKMYLSKKFSHVKVELAFNSVTKRLTTDRSGNFSCCMDISKNKPPAPGWHHIKASLPAFDYQTTGSILILYKDNRFGVISDVDDTILVSHATRPFKKLYLLLTKNAATRLAFPGVGEFYHALQENDKHEKTNPLFFVSNSEWNIYPLLKDFCKINDIPDAPFLLRSVNKKREVRCFDKEVFITKKDRIKFLLRFFNGLSFVLIGDSGQKDARLYSELIKEFPGRIKAVYIRNIGIRKRAERVIKIIEGARSEKVDMLLIKDTDEAFAHAREKGLVQV